MSLGCVLVYGVLFGTGSLLYGRLVLGGILMAVAAVAGLVLARLLRSLLR
jgi:hypothetical protein